MSVRCVLSEYQERGVYLHVMEDGTTEVEELAMARVHDVERSPAVIPHKLAGDHFRCRLAFEGEVFRRRGLVD